MKSKLFLAATFLFFTNCFAQDSSSVKTPTGKPYTLHVYKTDGSVVKGYLYGASGSGISMTHTTKAPTAFTSLTPEQIDKLFLRRKGSIGKGAILGALGGAAIGLIIGSSTTDDEMCDLDLCFPSFKREENMVVGTTVGLFAGAGLGMIIGALTRKKFIIHGKKENYQFKYPAIVERAMIQH